MYCGILSFVYLLSQEAVPLTILVIYPNGISLSRGEKIMKLRKSIKIGVSIY